MRNDWNHTTAAAVLGCLAALAVPPVPLVPDDAEEGTTKAADAVQPPASWDEAPDDLKQSLLNAVAFLGRFVGTGDLKGLDRDTAAMALATQCKDTPLAALKPNYGVVVSVFISVRQAHGL